MYAAFDLEISKEIPPGCDDWKSLRPLGISCAATLTSDSELRLWHGAEQADGRLAGQMAPTEVVGLTRYLAILDGLGYHILTWNGLGFDFDVLAEESRDRIWEETCKVMALHHIDIGFQMFCEKGFMIGLDACAHGLGLSGKVEGMHGDLAPEMWAKGRAEQDQVLEYVAQDVRTTAEVYEAILTQRRVYWTTSRGTLSRYPWQPRTQNGRLLTVEEALQTPEPDTAWMVNPWPRSKFHGWTGYKSG